MLFFRHYSFFFLFFFFHFHAFRGQFALISQFQLHFETNTIAYAMLSVEWNAMTNANNWASERKKKLSITRTIFDSLYMYALLFGAFVSIKTHTRFTNWVLYQNQNATHFHNYSSDIDATTELLLAEINLFTSVLKATTVSILFLFFCFQKNSFIIFSLNTQHFSVKPRNWLLTKRCSVQLMACWLTLSVLRLSEKISMFLRFLFIFQTN